MKPFILFVLLSLVCTSAIAQHSLQLDDGAGHYSLITGQTVNPLDIYLLPPGGGMLLTSGSCWMTAGNNLTGAEIFGSLNNFDVIMQTNSIEQLRLLEI